MHKVETISLNSRAYKLNDDAYQALHAYFDDANKELAGNPDKDEIIGDLEQAVADKLERYLHDKKEVVTADEVATVLSEVGSVSDDSGAQPKRPAASSRRLYVIPEGGMLLGVCNGVGAYLGVNPNFVRLGFVLLTMLTSGFWIIAYFILALFLPYAKTPEQIAEAYNRPVTAKDIVSRVTSAPTADGVEAVGNVVAKAGRIVVRVIGVFAALLFGALTFSWLYAMAMLLLGKLTLHGQLAELSGWKQAVVMGLLYLLVTIPIVVVWRVCYLLSAKRQNNKSNIIGLGLLGGLWVVAAFALSILASVYSGNVRNYLDTHGGYLDVGSSHICVDRGQCGDMQDPYYYHYRYQPMNRPPLPPRPVE